MQGKSLDSMIRNVMRMVLITSLLSYSPSHYLLLLLISREFLEKFKLKLKRELDQMTNLRIFFYLFR